MVVTVLRWGVLCGRPEGYPPEAHAAIGPFLRLCDTYRATSWLKVRDSNGQVCIVRRKSR